MIVEHTQPAKFLGYESQGDEQHPEQQWPPADVIKVEALQFFEEVHWTASSCSSAAASVV